MSEKKNEAEKDLRELRVLVNESLRPRIKEHLMKHCIKLEEELRFFSVEQVSSLEKNVDLQWKAIDKFAWEEDIQFMRIYVTSLDGLKTHPKNKIAIEKTENSLIFSIIDFKGVNYRLKIVKLHKNITDVRYTLKSNGFSLRITKERPGVWETLNYKQDPVERAENKRSGMNASDTLVEMMKDMYENGDEKTRKTIAQAWMGPLFNNEDESQKTS